MFMRMNRMIALQMEHPEIVEGFGQFVSRPSTELCYYYSRAVVIA